MRNKTNELKKLNLLFYFLGDLKAIKDNIFHFRLHLTRFYE